jgi:hypothetical protein
VLILTLTLTLHVHDCILHIAHCTLHIVYCLHFHMHDTQTHTSLVPCIVRSTYMQNQNRPFVLLSNLLFFVFCLKMKFETATVTIAIWHDA